MPTPMSAPRGVSARLSRHATTLAVIRGSAINQDGHTSGITAPEAASVTDGSFDGSLLGMRFLSRFGRIEIEGDRMRLTH